MSPPAPSRAHRDDTRRRAALARKQKDAAERIGWATSLTTAHEEIARLKAENAAERELSDEMAKVLATYVVLGVGRCTIGKPTADRGLSALQFHREARRKDHPHV